MMVFHANVVNLRIQQPQYLKSEFHTFENFSLVTGNESWFIRENLLQGQGHGTITQHRVPCWQIQRSIWHWSSLTVRIVTDEDREQYIKGLHNTILPPSGRHFTVSWCQTDRWALCEASRWDNIFRSNFSPSLTIELLLIFAIQCRWGENEAKQSV